MMEVHLMTPLTWSAALVPPLSKWGAEPVVCESGSFPELNDTVAACILHIQSANLVAAADWIEALASVRRSSNRRGLEPLLVVVGTDAVRYQWKLRELGVTDVAAHVWEAPRVAAIVHRHLARLPQSDNRWPDYVRTRLASLK